MLIKRQIRIITFIAFLASFTVQTQSSSLKSYPTIVFATSFPQDSFYFKKYQGIYSEAFKRMGYNFELNVYPSKRLAQAVNAGNIDGDVSRIKLMHTNNKYPNMIRVDEPITTMDISAFGQNKNEIIRQWHDLKKGNYLVAYPRGYRIVELNLLPLVKTERIIEVSDSLQGCRMLIGNRFDILIDVKRTVELLLEQDEFQEHQVQHLGILETIILYPYLNKKNKHLVQDLAYTLKTMKNDGSYNQIIDQINLRSN